MPVESHVPDTAPAPPDDAHLRLLQRRTEDLAASTTGYTSTADGAPEAVHAALDAAVSDLGPDLLSLSRGLHADPEEAFAETRSVAAVADLLARHGVVAEVGAHGLPTALRATSGDGDGPVVAVVAEYDALPGIGHGCGHNVIAASAVGAFLALDRVRTEHELPGTVVLLGTPAEEGGGGKVVMADAGAWDGLDAALMVHPFSHDVADQPFLGRRQLEVVYTGVAAHASAQPFMGRNALDAGVLAYQGVAMLRQHLPDSDRVHGVVVDGGQRPNVVPERSSARYYLRSADPATLEDLCRRVADVATGAALMTGCGVELQWDPAPPYLPLRHNRSLSGRWTRSQQRRGRRVLPRGVVPEALTGSTDMGNVSQLVPSLHAMVAVSDPGVALHTAEFAAAAGSPAGDAAVLDSAYGLAAVAADLLSDDDLRAAVATDFREGPA